jgi:hypothetical protein
MSQSSCEFIYFRIKPSVNPEDPSNEEGEALLNVFRLTKHQSGHQSSAWGRASEDKNMIVWVLGEFFLLIRSLCPYSLQIPATQI